MKRLDDEGGLIRAPITTTDFGRAAVALEKIETQVLTRVQAPALLEVGLGRFHRKGSILCPVVPYQIAARLEASGLQYTLDLLDIDPVVLADIRKRTKIFTSNDSYFSDSRIKRGWDEYLRDTGQEDSVVEADPELVIDEVNARLERERVKYGKPGYRRAEIPASFLPNLEAGRIRTLNQDIAGVPLDLGRYDFVSCMYVLYQLSPEGEEAALRNIASSLKTGGLFLFTDSKGKRFSSGRVILEEFGGWLTDNILSSMGFEVVERDSRARYSTSAHVLLRRV